MSYHFKIMSRYSFEVYGPEILGQDFNALVLTGIMGYRDAMQSGHDVEVRHKQLFSYLPTGTPEDYTRLTYLKFTTAAGDTAVIAQEWIKTTSIQERENFTCLVTIPESSPQDAALIRQILAQNGFAGFKIEFQ